MTETGSFYDSSLPSRDSKLLERNRDNRLPDKDMGGNIPMTVSHRSYVRETDCRLSNREVDNLYFQLLAILFSLIAIGFGAFLLSYYLYGFVPVNSRSVSPKTSS